MESKKFATIVTKINLKVRIRSAWKSLNPIETVKWRSDTVHNGAAPICSILLICYSIYSRIFSHKKFALVDSKTSIKCIIHKFRFLDHDELVLFRRNSSEF